MGLIFGSLTIPEIHEVEPRATSLTSDRSIHFPFDSHVGAS